MTVLCYHSVDAGWVSPLTVGPSDFDRQCTWLAAHRKVVSLDDFVPAVLGGAHFAQRAVALTFDDGFASLHENALPILKRHRLPATVFVVGRTLVDNRPMDWIRPEPRVPQYALSREQILEMRDLGVSFGSHSFAHLDLCELSEAECFRDLKESREVLEELLGEPVRYLAYPFGRHAIHVRRAAERVGFTGALSLPDEREPGGQYAIARAGIYRGNGLPTVWVKSSQSYLRWRTGRLYPVVHRLVRPAVRLRSCWPSATNHRLGG